MSLKGDLQLDIGSFIVLDYCLVVLFIEMRDRKQFINNPLSDPNNC